MAVSNAATVWIIVKNAVTAAKLGFILRFLSKGLNDRWFIYTMYFLAPFSNEE